MVGKVGILTFQGSSNYGAILQAFALNRTINDLGENCETINYHCQAVEQANRAKILSLKDAIKNIYKIWKEFECRRFVEKEILVSKGYDKSTIESADYDVYIVGSDQVWNPHCTNNDGTFFLDFTDAKSKKYSYAASIGLDENAAIEIMRTYKDLLNDFSALSFREKLSTIPPEGILKSTIRYDIDPVFLINKEQWYKLCSQRICNKKYIFVYLIGEPCKIYDFVTELERQTGYCVIDSKRSIEFIRHCSPYNFLSWIYHAEYIVTNSFHGTALSVIMHKNFYVECQGKSGYNYRVDNLLSLFELSCRKTDGNRFSCEEQPIDWDKVDLIKDKNVMDSLNYLKSIISKDD